MSRVGYGWNCEDKDQVSGRFKDAVKVTLCNVYHEKLKMKEELLPRERPHVP